VSRKLIIPVFIPHLGCPHTCVFCNQKKISGSYQQIDVNQVNKIVDKHLKTFHNLSHSFVELAFYGGSFTGIADELQEQLLSLGCKLKRENKIQAIRMSTRPDYINPAIIYRLRKYKVDTVELGVQSLDPFVLQKSERGHSVQAVIEAVKSLKEAEISVGIQLMPGLPGDTEEKVITTTKEVIKLKPDFVRIYPTVVIRETKLADCFQTGKFTPWSLEKAIEVSAKMFILFSRDKITIIRIGLQATENLVEGKDLIAGPYHPAFGELVKARVFRKQIEYLLESKLVKPIKKKLQLYCQPQEISQVKGQGKNNLQYFFDNYQLNLEVLPREGISRGSLACKNIDSGGYFIFSRREFLDRYRIS